MCVDTFTSEGYGKVTLMRREVEEGPTSGYLKEGKYVAR